MTETELDALKRYISAVAFFMTTRGGGIRELIAARKHLEITFIAIMPEDTPAPFPDIL